MATKDTQLEQIIFNTLSQEKYDELKASGQINPNEIYLVPDTEEVPENVVQSDNYENAKLWKGTLAEYEALGTYDDSITYIITDDNEDFDVYTKEEVDEKLENVTVDLSDYATKTYVSSVVSPKADTVYVDRQLDLKLDKTELPTKVSEFENDSGYLTEHQDISGKADKSTTLSGYGITDAYTKDEIDNKLGNLSEYATVEYVNEELGKKVDSVQYTSDLEKLALDHTSINNTIVTINETVNSLSSNLSSGLNNLDELKANKSETYTKEEIDAKGYLTEHQDISGKADRETTYTKEEVDELVSNATSNIQGGEYIDVIKPKGETLYEHDIFDMAIQQYGISTCKNIFITSNTFDYTGVSLYDMGKLDGNSLDLYSSTIPESFIQYMLPALKEDRTQYTIRDIITEEYYNKLNSTFETPFDSFEEMIAYASNGNANADAPVYILKFEQEGLSFLICAYPDNLGNYMFLAPGMWDLEPINTITNDGDGLLIDWNEKALSMFENIDALPSQEGNGGKFLTTDGTVASWSEIPEQVSRLSELENDVGFITNNELPTNVSAFTNDAGYLTEHQDISGKADKSDTYTKSEVDAKVTSIYRMKGSVANYDALPTSDLVIGDVYNVEDTGSNYVWTGTNWDKLGETVDLTPYLTKEEASTTYETIANVNTLKTNLESAISTKANQETTYTKEETNNLLNVKANDTEVVHLAGEETITGAKTFEISPLVPTIEDITDSTQNVASTKFVQDVVNTARTTITYWD